jgi:hypothetical protein
MMVACTPTAHESSHGSIRPPKHAARGRPPPFHYEEIVSLAQRDAGGVSQTPGFSGSAATLLDQAAPVLRTHQRAPLFFRLFYDFIASSTASCLTAAPEAEAAGNWGR